MKKVLSIVAVCMALLVFASPLRAQLKSFPGAEGAGAFTSGGRGTPSVMTTVFEVTNLSDVNSPGSLRYACSQAVAYRTIVFRVAGTIHLNSRLNIPANTTIAGQTAPGAGICIADYPVVINGNNVILRYLRIRLGDKNQLKTSPAGCGLPVSPFTDACRPIDGSGGDDALGDLGHKNIIVDHCSVSWSTDEALTMYRGDSLTIQWTIISEPLNYSYHFETGDTDFENHGYGGIWGAQHASFHHNLFAHCRNRTPRFAGNETYPAGVIESADFRNNVLYNWGINNIYGGAGGQYNLVNNYYKSGPNTSSGVRYKIISVDKDDGNGLPFAKYFLSGNYVDGSPVNTANNWTGALMIGGTVNDTNLSKVNTPFLADYLPASTHTAQQAYDSVLKYGGCTLPLRDTLDERIMNDVRNKSGRIIDVQGGFPHGTPYPTTVNAWPNLATGSAPVDADHDGMTDEWENANGLNPNNAADRGLVAPNGYTNLENYLNSISSASVDPVPPTGAPASAMWPLSSAADTLAITTGDLAGTGQTFGPTVIGSQYSTFSGIPGWQRVDIHNYLPIGYSAENYVEYKLAPTNGKKFTATKMQLSALGGGTGTAKMALYYSLDDFATSFPVGPCTYNGATVAATVAEPVSLLNTSTTLSNDQQVATLLPNIEVEPGKTLSVRVYSWISGTGNRYFASQLVTISGVTSDPALPLSLRSFSAGLQSGKTQLQWQTSNEQNMLRFEVEKSSDAVNYTSIGTVLAQNTQSGQYSFTDISIEGATSYYRLKIINKDGSFTYSYVVVLNKLTRDKVSLYPNPATHVLTLSYGALKNPGNAIVFDMQGRKLMSVNLAANSSQTSFSIEQLVKGTYVLQYNNDEGLAKTIKFSKL